MPGIGVSLVPLPRSALRTFFTSVGLTLLWGMNAAAQIPGNIDWPVGAWAEGTVVAVDATQGLNFDSGESLYLGARAVFGLPEATVWLGAGYAGLSGAGDNIGTGGAGLALPLAESNATRLSLEAGFGVARKSGSWIWGAPAGVALWFGPADAPVRPFVRVHGIVGGGAGSGTDVGASGIGGIEARLDSGVGLHLALQWEKLGEGEALVIGGGVSFGR